MKKDYTKISGRNTLMTSAMGFGCWAIGGPFRLFGKQDGWGEVNDEESIRAIRRAIDLGVTFFDTADCYGAGHSERVVGQAVKGLRDKVTIATKFGYVFDEATKQITGENASPDYIRNACEASLRRLGMDYIDLYQLHIWTLSHELVPLILDTLDALVAEGKIRAYGWSTDGLENIRVFAERPNCAVAQFKLNVLEDAKPLIECCEQQHLAGINRTCLAMGLLSGKFSAESQMSADDVRGAGHDWVNYFRDGKPVPEFLEKVEVIREILRSNGRTLVQGALAWIWGRSSNMVPIPGFKSVKQVEENAKSLEFGPLTSDQMAEIDRILGR